MRYKKLFSLLGSGLFFFSSLAIPVDRVNAVVGSFPDSFVASGVDSSVYEPYLEALKDNQSVVNSGYDELYVCFSTINATYGCNTFIFSPLYSEDFTKNGRNMTVYYGVYTQNVNIKLEDMDDYVFTFNSIDSLPSSDPGTAQNSVLANVNNTTPYQTSVCWYSNNTVTYGHGSNPCKFISKLSPTFDPIIGPLLDYPYNLDIQSQSFTEWLISTQKYKEINDSMLANHVSPFVELFNQYGGSSSFFVKVIKQFFDFSHIGDGISDYQIILRKTRQLYQEYLRLKNDTVGNHLLPKVSSTIEPDTNDSNQTLITNTVNDTEIEKLLRDILRTLLSFPSTWYDMHQQLMIKLDQLDLTTNIVNDGGTNDLDVLFNYDQDEFDSDWNSFEDLINDDINSKTALIDSINNRSVMPENMLSDQTTFSLTVPFIDGYTVSQDGSEYTTNIHNYTFDMSEHTTFDAVFKKIKRFIGVIMIIAYLVSLRFRIPRIVRGES